MNKIKITCNNKHKNYPNNLKLDLSQTILKVTQFHLSKFYLLKYPIDILNLSVYINHYMLHLAGNNCSVIQLSGKVMQLIILKNVWNYFKLSQISYKRLYKFR